MSQTEVPKNQALLWVLCNSRVFHTPLLKDIFEAGNKFDLLHQISTIGSYTFNKLHHYALHHISKCIMVRARAPMNEL